MNDISYVLRNCREDFTSFKLKDKFFRWPANGTVTCDDFVANGQCGNGLHGYLNGVGDGRLMKLGEAQWLLVEVITSEINHIDGCVKFPRGNVIFCSKNRAEVISELERLSPAAKHMAVIGAERMDLKSYSTVVVGDFGSATAGNFGNAVAGIYGFAKTGENGSAMVGSHGQAIAGPLGLATAGDEGIARVGYGGHAVVGSRGQASAGYSGTITFKFFDNGFYKSNSFFVDDKDIKANILYRFNGTGLKMSRADELKSFLETLQGVTSQGSQDIFTHLFKQGCTLLELSDDEAARLFDTSTPNIRRWISGKVVPPAASLVLRFMREAVEARIKTISPDR